MAAIDDITATVSPITTEIVGALLILFVGFIIGRLAGLLVRRVLGGVKLDKSVRKAVGQRISLERGLSGLTSFVIYIASIIMALNFLGLTTLVLTIILGVLVLILGISFLLAVRDFLPNAFAGLSIKYRGDFSEGDRISVRGVVGKVEEVSLLTTRVRSKEDMLILPNALFQREGYKVKR